MHVARGKSEVESRGSPENAPINISINAKP